ncbi:hypothetical protein BI347_00070 [Chromobacterium sphagni]|uniref:Uncharacterized protein n=1 Tax=Chromobacterium sphagni TaxID=1903179 RepID=A0A1S1WXR5_9NEIS|nr:hypothetical protein BI347_00070 [Chromobacterium sphagni]
MSYRREAPTELATRQWERRLESELAEQSVCRAIALRDAANGRRGVDASRQPASGGPATGDAMENTPARGPIAADARGAAGVAAPAAGPLGGQAAAQGRILPARVGAGLWAGPTRTAASAESLAAGKSAGLAAEMETVVRSWLKPYKVTVFADGDQVRVWIRDARLGADDAQALRGRLEQYMKDSGGRLALLAINGALVESGADAMNKHDLKQG